jgi:large subunit ribosomal protein L22
MAEKASVKRETSAMSFRASHRFARISPRKVRPLADLIRGKFADEALDILRYQPQRGARMLEKVLQSALGNAQDPDQTRGQVIDLDNLVISEARVDNGPMFKRIRPRARGMAFMIRKRMSHIHITVADIDEI